MRVCPPAWELGKVFKVLRCKTFCKALGQMLDTCEFSIEFLSSIKCREFVD